MSDSYRVRDIIDKLVTAGEDDERFADWFANWERQGGEWKMRRWDRIEQIGRVIDAAFIPGQRLPRKDRHFVVPYRGYADNETFPLIWAVGPTVGDIFAYFSTEREARSWYEKAAAVVGKYIEFVELKNIDNSQLLAEKTDRDELALFDDRDPLNDEDRAYVQRKLGVYKVGGRHAKDNTTTDAQWDAYDEWIAPYERKAAESRAKFLAESAAFKIEHEEREARLAAERVLEGGPEGWSAPKVKKWMRESLGDGATVRISTCMQTGDQLEVCITANGIETSTLTGLRYATGGARKRLTEMAFQSAVQAWEKAYLNTRGTPSEST